MTLDGLVDAWLKWDRYPGHESAAHAKCDAIAALGLDSNLIHNRTAELRQTRMDAESAVRQAAAEQEVFD